MALAYGIPRTSGTTMLPSASIAPDAHATVTERSPCDRIERVVRTSSRAPKVSVSSNSSVTKLGVASFAGRHTCKPSASALIT